MSMIKAIENKKEHRKLYIGKNYCKSVDTHCRNHGGRYHSWECPWCLDNRTYKEKQLDKIAKQEIKQYK